MLDATSFFGRDRVTLYHGSQNVLKRPEFGVGNPHNDYGLAFYTTELPELAFEWACPRADDGWVNEYLIDVRDLNVIDLGSSEFTVLNWMAVLLEHRKVSVGVGIVGEAREFLVANYAVDLSAADLVHGYRADDSYFHIARAFLGNRISVEVLEQSLFLGGLGYQIAVVSERAFGRMEWVSAKLARGATWNPRRIQRDAAARAAALRLEREGASFEGTYVIDLMRGESSWAK